MPDVVVAPAPAAAPVAPPPVAEAKPAAPAEPKDRRAAALELLHKNDPKPEEAPAEGKVEAAPAAPAEDPEEKLHVAMSKLNRREAEIRQRELSVKQQLNQSKADKEDAERYRALKTRIKEQPRTVIKELAGDDDSEIFNKYVSETASTPEQLKLEQMQAEIERLKKQGEEDKTKTQEQKQREHVDSVARDYRGGVFKEMQATPEKFANAHVAAQTREVFEISPAKEGRPARYGNIYDVALDVADRHAALHREIMPHAVALGLVEKWLENREAERTGHRQKLVKPPAAVAAEPTAEEKKPPTVVTREKPRVVRHTLTNNISGNVPNRVPQSGKKMSRDERLAAALKQLRK